MTYGRVHFAHRRRTLDGAAVSHSAELVRGHSFCPLPEGPLRLVLACALRACAVAPNTLRPTRVALGVWAGEGSGARTPGSFEGNAASALHRCRAGLRARRTARPSPSLSFFPGVADATGAAALQPPARTMGARRQRPLVGPGWTDYRRSRKRGDWAGQGYCRQSNRVHARASPLRVCAAHVDSTRPTAPADGAPSSRWRARRRGRCGRAWPRPRDGRPVAATAAGRLA